MTQFHLIPWHLQKITSGFLSDVMEVSYIRGFLWRKYYKGNICFMCLVICLLSCCWLFLYFNLEWNFINISKQRHVGLCNYYPEGAREYLTSLWMQINLAQCINEVSLPVKIQARPCCCTHRSVIQGPAMNNTCFSDIYMFSCLLAMYFPSHMSIISQSVSIYSKSMIFLPECTVEYLAVR